MSNVFRSHPRQLAATLGALALALGACATEANPVDDVDEVEEVEDVEDVAAALEMEDGGYDMEDESPMFGIGAAFEDTGQAEVDVVYADALEDDAETRALMERPDAAVYRVQIQWGQLPGDRDEDTARNWTGAIRINRGALLVRGLIGFEHATNRVLPREDRTEVRFTSVTRPHRDGLRLLVVNPAPLADEPLVLAYTTLEGDRFEVPLVALLDGPLVEEVDDTGNHIAAVAMVRPVNVCEHGFLAGRWGALRPGLGRLIGRVVDADGAPKGHVRGIYGKRASGEQVFFAKFIGRDGRFRGILAGRYADGDFAGRWMTRAGEYGRVAGHYREGDASDRPTDRPGGQFMGRWAERSCDVVVGGDRGE